MKKRTAIAYMVAFILLFIMPTVLYSCIGEYIDNTNYEQRTTAEKPTLSFENIEAYPALYEQYFNDALPFRTQMIEINGLIKCRVFKQSPVEKVIIGKDGWLFYNPDGSDGDPIADYNGSNLYSEEMLAMCADNLLSARDYLAARGKEFVVFIAPNKECIYGEQFLPTKYGMPSKETTGSQIADYLRENTDLNVVDPKGQIVDAVLSNPDKEYYFKTDTHWNQLGAYYGAKELIKTLDISLPDLSEMQITEESGYAGDLSNMMSMPKYYNYDTKYSVNPYDKGQNFATDYPIEGDKWVLHYSTEKADSRTVLMVRDSFGEAMFQYIASCFDDCYYIHKDHYKPEYIDKFAADIVVLEVVERYAPYLMTFTAEQKSA